MSDELYAATARKMMEAHGYRVLALARTLSRGLCYGPTVWAMKLAAGHCYDELEHYETLSRLYESFTGHPLEPVVEHRITERPPPPIDGWFELSVQWLLQSRAALWQLREHDTSSFAPFRELSSRIARDETLYQGSIERVLLDAARAQSPALAPVGRDEVFLSALRASVASFGRPNTPGTGYAITVGLKKRDAGPVVRDFLDDIGSVARAAGLVVPTHAELGVDPMPEG